MSAGGLAGKTIHRNALLVVAANGPYYGGGFTVAAGARMRDGRLTLSIYRRFSKWELLRHFHSISQGRYRYSPKIETFSAAEMELASPNVIAVHIDGRPLGKTPVKLRALSGALRVFAPKPPEARSERGEHMPDPHDRTEKSDNASAALERGVAEIKTPEQARHALDSLAKIAGDLREEDVACAVPEASPEQQAAAIEEAGDVPAAAKAASVIATAAVQSANAAPDEKAIVDEAVTQALGGGRVGLRPRTRVVAAATDLSRNTIAAGLRELPDATPASAAEVPPPRIRRAARPEGQPE
jgi:hypothetical protein